MYKYLSFVFLLFPLIGIAQYTGTASVTQGLATPILTNLYPCTNGRITNIGTITASDSTTWTVPASVNYLDPAFPFASNLYNSCNGATYTNEAAALAALNGSDIINVDPGGELITAYLFADNYFEMYINGVPVGKDNVPYTQFNSNIVRFRVNRPFTIAIMLVDWEEHLGTGCEVSNGFQYHMGDGGLVAVLKDSLGQIIAKTGSDWRAQTYYTAPILNLSCLSESGNRRLSDTCSTQDSNNGTSYYGLHWTLPLNWMDASFNDTVFPMASTFSNAVVGVNNKPAYTNFSNIFDDLVKDAEFIWSTNLVLDNLVLTRYTVPLITGTIEGEKHERWLNVYPNPAKSELMLEPLGAKITDHVKRLEVYDTAGKRIMESGRFINRLSLEGWPSGSYTIRITVGEQQMTYPFLIEK